MQAKILVQVSAIALGLHLLGCDRGAISFVDDVQPILSNHCIECHNHSGEGVATSGFSVQNYASVMRGTKFGAVVIPGSSISSTLYLVVAQKTAPEIHMPPHHTQALAEGRGMPLSEDQVETIAAWIDQGAQHN